MNGILSVMPSMTDRIIELSRDHSVERKGRGGYRRGTWKGKPAVQRAARRVSDTARNYQSQLARCEGRFRCDSWYQVWPFCG